MTKGMRPRTVEEYVAEAPRKAQAKLKSLRAAIRATAPKAEERISYGIPYYDFKGRLAYFRLTTTHIGLYIPPPVIKEHTQELNGYSISTATVRFPLSEKLPIALVKKLVRSRMKKNEAAYKK